MQHIVIACPACHCNFTVSVAWPTARPPQPVQMPLFRQGLQQPPRETAGPQHGGCSQLPQTGPRQCRPYADILQASTNKIDEGMLAEARGELTHARSCYKQGAAAAIQTIKVTHCLDPMLHEEIEGRVRFAIQRGDLINQKLAMQGAQPHRQQQVATHWPLQSPPQQPLRVDAEQLPQQQVMQQAAEQQTQQQQQPKHQEQRWIAGCWASQPQADQLQQRQQLPGQLQQQQPLEDGEQEPPNQHQQQEQQHRQLQLQQVSQPQLLRQRSEGGQHQQQQQQIQPPGETAGSQPHQPEPMQVEQRPKPQQQPPEPLQAYTQRRQRVHDIVAEEWQQRRGQGPQQPSQPPPMELQRQQLMEQPSSSMEHSGAMMTRYVKPSPKTEPRRQAAFQRGGTAKRLRSAPTGAWLRSSSSAGASSSAGEEAVGEQHMQADTSCEEAWERPGSFIDLLLRTSSNNQGTLVKTESD